MSKQPEALRLAETYADRVHDYRIRATEETYHDMMVFRDALDAELRRLYAVNEELLEALEGCEAFLLSAGFESSDVYAEVCAALAKAGGEA